MVENLVATEAEASGCRSLPEVFAPDGNVRTLQEIEADIIRFAVSHYGGHMSEAARRLRISRSTLYRKMDENSHPTL